jgi:hypothetical protein
MEQRILKLEKDDEAVEDAFDLEFLLALTAEQRMALALEQSLLLAQEMEAHGHSVPAPVAKRPVRARAVPSTLAGEPVLVPCLDDLIAMKAAAGRPKDLEDLRHLLEIRSRVQRQ